MNGSFSQTQKPLVSIIMPAYNVEGYIAQTIECLLCQTVNDLEILVIDDGSTDDTSSEVHTYELRDDRVKLFRTENGGPSRARNLGIDKACGRYIMFVDSDDVVSPDFVETLINLLIKHDCQCSACGINAYKGLMPDEHARQETTIYEDYMVKYLALDKPKGFLCNKGFLASFITENSIRLREDIHQSEDMLFLLDYLSYCDKFAYTDDVKYFYRQRGGSLTNSLNNEHWFDVLTVFEAYRDRFSDNRDASDAVKRNFLPVAYEGQYRYRVIGDNNNSLKTRLDAMLDYCKPIAHTLPLVKRIKLLVTRYCMRLVIWKRLGGVFK